MQYKPTYTNRMIRKFYKDKAMLKKGWIEDSLNQTGAKDTPEIVNILDKLFEAEFLSSTVTYNNSVEGIDRKIETLQFLSEVFEKDKIIVENGVLFRNSRETFAPSVHAEIYLFHRRKEVKKKGNYYLTEGNDPILGALYNELQKNIKILMNTYYGVLTNPYSRFYNRDLGDSITCRGRSSISVSAMSLEGAFSKRIPYRIDALLYYISKASECEVEESILQEMLAFGFTADDFIREFNLSEHYALPYIRQKIDTLDSVQIAKLIFKNNFDLFLHIPRIETLFKELYTVCTTEEIPFLDPNEPPFIKSEVDGKDVYTFATGTKEMLNEIKLHTSQILEGVYWYGGDYVPERKKKTNNLQETIQNIHRNTVVLIDTDSNMINYNTELNKITEVLSDIDDRTMTADNKYYTISNMCATIICEVIDSALNRYKDHVNILPEKSGCLRLKNEFLFSKFLLTSRKKNYVAIVRLCEGKAYPAPKLDVKGLVFTKSSVNATIGEKVESIVDAIMKTENLDMTEILKSVRKYTDEVSDSHKTRELLEYCVTLKIKTKMEDTDSSDYRGKAISLWNAIAKNESEIIVPPAAFYAVPINLCKRDELREKYPEEISKIEKWIDDRNVEVIMEQINSVICDERSKKFTFIKFVYDNYYDRLQAMTCADDWSTIRQEAMKRIKFEKLGIKSQNVNFLDIEEINKIAFPLTLTTPTDFLLDIVEPLESSILVNSLSAPVLQELHITCPRNKSDKRLVTNILDVF